LRWLFTAGELEVDGKSYIVPAKPAKAPKAKKQAKVKVPAKAEAKAAATNQRRLVRTKKLAKAA
jgi:hypothetical protein